MFQSLAKTYRGCNDAQNYMIVKEFNFASGATMQLRPDVHVENSWRTKGHSVTTPLRAPG